MQNNINNISDNQEQILDIGQVQSFFNFMQSRESDSVGGNDNRFIAYIRGEEELQKIVKGDQNGLFKQLTPNQQAIIKSYYNPDSLDINFQDILDLQRTIFGDITKPYINLIISKYRKKYGIDLSVEGNVEIFLKRMLTAIEYNYIGPVPEHQIKFFSQKTDIVGSNAYLAAALHNVVLHKQDNDLQTVISQDYFSDWNITKKIAAILKTNKKDNSLDFVRREIFPNFLKNHQAEVIPNTAIYTDDGGFVNTYYSKSLCEKCIQEVQGLIVPKGYKSLDVLKKEFVLTLMSTIDNPIMNEYRKIIKGEILNIMIRVGMYKDTIEKGSQMLEENQSYKDFKNFISELKLSEPFVQYVRIETIHKGRGNPIENRMRLNECCSPQQAKKINQYIKDFNPPNECR